MLPKLVVVLHPFDASREAIKRQINILNFDGKRSHQLKSKTLLRGGLLSFFKLGVIRIASVICLVLMFLVTIDVILRFFFKLYVPASVELCRVLLAMMIFLPFGEVQERKEHIRIDFFIDRLSPKIKRYWELIANIVSLSFLSAIFVDSIDVFRGSLVLMEYFGSAIKVPIYPARGVMVLGCGLMIIELTKEIVMTLSPRKDLSKK